MTLIHRTIEANGMRLHCVEQGEGPLVLLVHGFPESWYSWRHQLPAIAEAGYRAVALDVRGYGRSSKPHAVGEYSMLRLAGDVVHAVGALGESEAILVGHDWGAPIVWNSALVRPDLFRGVAGLSVPYSARSGKRPQPGLLGDRRTRRGVLHRVLPGARKGRGGDREGRAPVAARLLLGGFRWAGSQPASDLPRPTRDRAPRHVRLSRDDARLALGGGSRLLHRGV
ncbi:MAG: alpha/beta hydrolase [Acidobacteriota bacterium]